MRARSLLGSGWVVYAIAIAPRCAPAQWIVGVDLTWTSFGDASSDTSAGSTGEAFHPGAGGAIALRVERQWSRFGFVVSARRMHPALAEESDALIIAAKQQMRFTEIAPAVTLRLARLAAGAVLQLQAGPVVDIWELTGLTERSEVGVATGLTLAFPLAGRWTGAARTSVAHSGSPFQSGELPDRFAPHAMWRHSVSVGLDWRL
ncbi:MAG TPA: hypothetical protein VLT79_12650 [Gemmatimonadales bacterium]|nr:hypothetical protein [Gemmatimonadales bacterium]